MPPNGALGVLAGGGPLPRRIVEACRRQNRPVFVVVFDGQGDPADFANADHVVLRLGAAGSAIKKLRSEGCDTLVMAGWIERPSLKELRPDLWAMKFFATSGADALGDDGLLRTLVKALEKEGFDVVGADTLVPELLMPIGVLGAHAPDDSLRADIDAALACARDLGARDLGQGAVVHQGRTVIEEDRAGTDAMLIRLAESENRGGVLAKALKPNQERRVDIPTLGTRTIVNAARAGLSGVVAEAGNAFLMDREDMIAAADAAGLFVLGVPPGETSS